MKLSLQSGLPEGTTWFARPDADAKTDEGGFCLLARGDRVWGRCRPAAPDRAIRGGVILFAPDGDSEHDWVSRALERWSAWATVASPDLPLCGRRRSEKLSAEADNPKSEAGRRLQPDLLRQLQEDLVRVAQLLASLCRVDPQRTAVVALGLGAARLLPCLEKGGWPPAVVLAPAPEASSLPLSVRALGLPEESGIDRWLDEVGSYLRGELGLGDA